MIRQGAADTISGAMPIVVSQSQPSARPPPVTPNPATARTRRLPIHDRSTPPGGWIDEAGAQHNADSALGTSVVAGATGASGFVISKPSMMSVSSGAVICQPGPKDPQARCSTTRSSIWAFIAGRSSVDRPLDQRHHFRAIPFSGTHLAGRLTAFAVDQQRRRHTRMARARDPSPDGST